MNDSAYSDRVPVQNTLHDWAPASDGNDDDYEEQLEEILHELRQQQPNTHPDILRVLGRSQLDTERESSRNRISASRLFTHSSELSSLRSAAILQSVRRHPRFSARSRDYMQRYIMDRERVGYESESRDRFNSSRLATSSLEDRRFEYARSAWQSQRSSESQGTLQGDTRTREYRRGFSEDPSSSASSSSPWLQQAITYLARLRSCASYDESLSHAIDANFVTKDFFGDTHEDFVLDISALPGPAPTSWLASGMVFSGSQHATATTSTTTPANASSGTTTRYLFRNNETMTSTTFDPPLSRAPPFDPARPWLSHTSSPPYTYGDSDTATPPSQIPDNWPVKVTIHAVDYDAMTLAATMEAYNVPSHPPSYNRTISTANNNSPPGGQSDWSSITTYLEGEMLDFQKHSFLTESFKSTTATDATYWRKLEPFASFTAEELVRKLVSKRFQRELAEKYVLMRWKERCFVRPTNSGVRSRPSTVDQDVWTRDEEMAVVEDGCGLTISGFYYVCLRREDGAVEGLYYDPQSSPYQHLKLRPVGRGVFPVWQFR